MRKATLFWLAMTVACGAVLFHTSQQVTDGRAALASTERELLREEESLRVLQAEWSYLNQPERLEKLARQHLELVPLNGKQFANVTDLNERIDEEALAAAAAADAATAVTEPEIEPAAGDVAPVVVEDAPKPAVLKPVAAKTAPVKSPAPAAPAPSREFGDVLKNLGVN